MCARHEDALGPFLGTVRHLARTRVCRGCGTGTEQRAMAATQRRSGWMTGRRISFERLFHSQGVHVSATGVIAALVFADATTTEPAATEYHALPAPIRVYDAL